MTDQRRWSGLWVCAVAFGIAALVARGMVAGAHTAGDRGEAPLELAFLQEMVGVAALLVLASALYHGARAWFTSRGPRGAFAWLAGGVVSACAWFFAYAIEFSG